MEVWTCDDHDGFYPVGTASVVVASTEDEARALLDAQLVAEGLESSVQAPYTLERLPLSSPRAVVIQNGDY